jgi:hypothetical protein
MPTRLYRQWSEFRSQRTLPRNTSSKKSGKLSEVNKPPDKWFQVLAGIVIRLKLDFDIKYDDKKGMGHILHNIMPKEYKHTIDSIQRNINHGVAVELKGVKDDIWEKYGDISK